ncbi:hypothetical protein KEM55_006915 [Ascosphaera atra]|nr:hypothetical protein KEM55_006915 [Ascosphaera atra]
MRNWDMSIYEEEFMMDVGRPRDTMRQELSLPFRSSRRRLTPWSRDTIFDTIEFEMAQDIEEQPIKRQQPVHTVCQPVSDPEIPYYQRIGESPDRQQKRVKHDIQTKLLKSNELKEQIDCMNADTDIVMDDDVCVEATSPLPTSLDMRKSIPNSVRKNGRNSLNSVPVPIITPTKTFIKTSPFLGPVGWTVPPKTSPQRSKPFLIYQDPQGEDPYRLLEFGSLGSAYAHSHDCSDDKENGPI